jgi:hypothetical protein
MDRNHVPSLVIFADIVCCLKAVWVATALIAKLNSHAGWHAVAASGSIYLGPTNYWLGRLCLLAGDRAKAQIYLEDAVSESQIVESVIYRAWSEYYLAQTVPLMELAKRRGLVASARRAAQRHRLGRLLEQLAESDRGAGLPMA